MDMYYNGNFKVYFENKKLVKKSSLKMIKLY